jgi:hypothetical protein
MNWAENKESEDRSQESGVRIKPKYRRNRRESEETASIPRTYSITTI